MTAPTFSDTTEDLYARLPEVYRVMDELQNPPWPLKRFVAAMCDQVGDVFKLIDTLDFEPVSSRDSDAQVFSGLANPDEADAAWLPWIGQVIGVPVNTALPEEDQRDQVRGPTSGFRAGTKAAIAAAARSVLTGTQTISIFDHSIANPGDGGGQWDVLIVTRTAETPSAAAVLQAVTDKKAKPAGINLRVQQYSTSWTTLQTNYATWAAVNGKSWQLIQQTGS